MIPDLIHNTILPFYVYNEEIHRNASHQKSKLNLKFEFLKEYGQILEMFDTDQRFQKIFLRRFQEDHIACIAYLENQPVHIAWIAFKQLWIDELKWLLRLTPTACCIYNVETLPQFRRRGIYRDVLLFITGWWLGMNGNTIVIYADKKNQPSILGIADAGFQQIGEIGCWIAFNKLVLSRSIDLRMGNADGTVV